MPRQARIDIPGGLYHIIARGIERRKIFLDKEDYEDFLLRYKIALNKTDSRCIAWCLMPNHFHLLILRGMRPLSELMRRLMTGYAVNFNIRHKRVGHLFQNRYKSILCEEDEYLSELAAYIHLNPLRAGIVENYESLSFYKWNGHSEIIRIKREKDSIIDMDYILNQFGDSERKALENYENFLKDRCNKQKRGEYSGGGLIKSMGGIENVLDFRRSGLKERFDDRILGGGNFVERVLRETDKKEEKKILKKEEIVRETEKVSGIKIERIFGKDRSREVTKARGIYCYLSRENGKSGGELMRELRLSSGAITYLYGLGRKVFENN